MEERESLVSLRGLYQDLSALSDSSLVNIDRLRVELETHIDDFRKLLDKPTKNNASRQAVLSGKLGRKSLKLCQWEQWTGFEYCADIGCDSV